MPAQMKTLCNSVYYNSSDNLYRYALGTKGNNTLFCFGINPSTATPEKYDPTLRRVTGVALKQGFDSLIMLNVYPLRATNPANLPYSLNEDEHRKNLQVILKLLKSGSTIWSAWGNLIDTRPWLRACRDEIFHAIKKGKENITWVKMGDLTRRQNPRHPLYTKYQDFSEFCV